jgi:hypothetical protein
MRRNETTKRTETRVNELIARFDDYVTHFNEIKKFSGPSLYFHHKTSVMYKTALPSELIRNELFLEYIYATLASWGMHRMGEGNTKLTDFDIFKNSIQSERENIEKLQIYEIDSIPIVHETQIISSIYQIISRLKVGIAETKIVAGSKTLHHILPNLVPPIDGEYTMKFFYNNRTSALAYGERVAFDEIYKNYIKICRSCRPSIISHLGAGMNTRGFRKTPLLDEVSIKTSS